MHSVNVCPADGVCPGAVAMPQNIKLDGSMCAKCALELPIGVPCVFVRLPAPYRSHFRYHGACAPMWTLASENIKPGANVK
jgi:hypothetical protein